MRGRHRGDDGSTIPLILLCFLIAALLVAGVSAASGAFLAQRDLQADCDGAAAAGADGIDPDAVYSGQLSQHEALPVATDHAQDAVDEYRSRIAGGDDSLSMAVSVTQDQVVVTCRRVVSVPFGRVFGLGDGLVREAVGSARSPLR